MKVRSLKKYNKDNLIFNFDLMVLCGWFISLVFLLKVIIRLTISNFYAILLLTNYWVLHTTFPLGDLDGWMELQQNRKVTKYTVPRTIKTSSIVSVSLNGQYNQINLPSCVIFRKLSYPLNKQTVILIIRNYNMTAQLKYSRWIKLTEQVENLKRQYI